MPSTFWGRFCTSPGDCIMPTGIGMHLLEPTTYAPILLQGKTVCIVGAGGIGQNVARLCVAAGMHVVGTKRSVLSTTILPGRVQPPRTR